MDPKFEDILTQAARIFQKYGIHAVSMDDICRELGISKKTLYKYVENKADLVEKILNIMHDTGLKELKKFESAAEGNAIDHLIGLGLHFKEKVRTFFPSITFELQKYYPEIFRKFQQQNKEEAYHYLVANMQKGIAEGLYRDDLDIDLVAKIYLQKIVAISDPEFLEAEKFSHTRIFQVMYENHIRGISNPAGIAYYESLLERMRKNGKEKR